MAIFNRVSGGASVRKADMFIRRLVLSDEDFLIVLSNKINVLEFEQTSLATKISGLIQSVLRLLRISKYGITRDQTKLLLTGHELMHLQKLTGFEAHEELLIHEDYEIDISVLRKLLEGSRKISPQPMSD